MAITRLGQLSAETQWDGDFLTFNGSPAIISSDSAKTGTYSYETTGKSPMGLGFSPRSQIRCSFWSRYAGLPTFGSGISPIFIFHVYGETLNDSHFIRYTRTTELIEMWVSGVMVATASPAAMGFNIFDIWHHFAATIKCDLTEGFFSLYFNGDQVLTYSGEIGGQIDAVYVSGLWATSSQAWGNPTYVDDYYVDDTTGEEDSAPSGRRFLYVKPNGVGISDEWTPVGDVTNYQTIDEAPPDEDITHNKALIPGLQDLFQFEDVTIPTDHVIRAVIPTATVRKTDAEYDGSLLLQSYDGSTVRSSSEISLQTTYKDKFVRWVNQNDGTAWDETDFNAYQFGYESA